MKNRNFSRLTKSERRAKLTAILRSRTANHLTDEEAETICLALPVDRQYLIRVCSDPAEFRCGLALADMKSSATVLGSAVAGGTGYENALFAPRRAAAYVTKRKCADRTTNLLQIYVPQEREALC